MHVQFVSMHFIQRLCLKRVRQIEIRTRGPGLSGSGGVRGHFTILRSVNTVSQSVSQSNFNVSYENACSRSNIIDMAMRRITYTKIIPSGSYIQALPY